KPFTQPSWMKDLTDSGQRIVKFLFGSQIHWDRLRNFSASNYELGVKHFDAGHVNDALLRFRLVTWSDPKNANAWYYLGRSLIANGQPDKAAAALRRALLLQPKHEEAA